MTPAEFCERREISTFLIRLGTETNQGAVGFVIDRDFLELRFPLKGVGHG